MSHWEGLDAALERLAAVVQDVHARALPVPEAETILAAAQERTPVESGRLRNSGRIVVDEAAQTVAIEFGGADVPYAITVHEKAGVQHPHGEWKFLETAGTAAAPDVILSVGNRVKVGE